MAAARLLRPLVINGLVGRSNCASRVCSLQAILGSMGFSEGTSGKGPACQCRRCKEMQVQFLGREDPLGEGMATNSSILAWRIP